MLVTEMGQTVAEFMSFFYNKWMFRLSFCNVLVTEMGQTVADIVILK